MKQTYLFIFLCTVIFNTSFSQQASNKNVIFNLTEVRQNVKDGLIAYNLEGLLYHARLSKEAINKAQELLEKENCKKTLTLANSMAIFLETATTAEDLVTGRNFLRKTENLIGNAFFEYELCKSASITVKDESQDALKTLKQQQDELKARQAELEQKARDIKLQLAEQEKQESLLKKQEFIAANESAVSNKVNAYNDVLKSCGCNDSMIYNPQGVSLLSAKSFQEIKSYYLDLVIGISENYTAKLKTCKKALSI